MDRPAAVHALQVAGTALRQGGINVQWEECLASAPATCNNEAIRGGACLEHQRARRTEARALASALEAAIPRKAAMRGCGAGTYDVTHLTVAVLPESMAAKLVPDPLKFGISPLASGGGLAKHAYVFFDRVTNFAKAELVPQPVLLGLFIAHEIGHLLLGGNSHSPAGIMRARWGPAEVKQAVMGVLSFNTHQVTKMRANVRRRMDTAKSEASEYRSLPIAALQY